MPMKNKRTLMIQGTTSDAGKSVMTAGLCRLLKNKGISVAPFKPQNMALNSAVTVDGGEIGRSQAAQAQACGLEPHTDFNPILLKPSSDKNAQVIVHGKAINAMDAVKYHDYKKFAMEAVLESHKRLLEQYDRILVEGAGSPAEINLRKNDIANMGFAEAVDCPVILVADIDRGGVFAQIIGTLELLSQSEQDRVIGFIINRFRGDIALLQPGLDWLEERSGKPVLGTIPYLKNFYLDAEDAICTDASIDKGSKSTPKNIKPINVVVPVLPRISNHTDFDVLNMHPHVNLQFVSIEQTCPPADLIILPGSKNVRGDLAKLKENGWDEVLQKHLRYGGKLIGICGGYQMLGDSIDDPSGIEGDVGSSSGFGFIAQTTTLLPEKQLRNVKGNLSSSLLENNIDGDLSKDTKNKANNELSFKGYEIHCGVTEPLEGVTIKKLLDINHSTSSTKVEITTSPEGAINADNNIIGSYVHGLFDHPEASKALLTWAGLNVEASLSVNIDDIREQQFDRLAKELETHLSDEFLKELLAT